MATQEQNIDKLVETLSELSVLDLSKLKKALEEKWDVKAQAGGAIMMAAAPAAAAATLGICPILICNYPP